MPISPRRGEGGSRFKKFKGKPSRKGRDNAVTRGKGKKKGLKKQGY